MDWTCEAERKIIEKMDWVSEKSRFKIPYTTVSGTHDNKIDEDRQFGWDDGVSWWTNGFWPGIMWLLYLRTGDQRYVDIARYAEKKLDQAFADFYGLHHDMGFVWLPSAVADYRITGNPESRKRGLMAATILSGRFNPAARIFRAWDQWSGAPDEDTAGWAIIDCMMNINLLYWASDETGDPRFREQAVMYADQVMKYYIRPDGSSNHIMRFDPVTGELIGSLGGQGYADGSSWTRGQAWAMYGFASSYIHTKDERYLDTAKRTAHYFIANIPENGLIPVDFRAPKQPYYEDSSAAAAAASALLELARLTAACESEVYRRAAEKLLKALYEKRCNFSKDSDCILEKCTAAYHHKNHEFHIIYGDYYFIEAIFKLQGETYQMW